MKPVQLTMKAFNSYKDEVIDFTELQNHRLFVLSGKTGAGKTTIFDAITYALYGCGSGTDRGDANGLRSHFATDKEHTSVEFVFELRGQKYRIFRQMAHIKSGNKSATGGKFEFVKIVGDAEVPVSERSDLAATGSKAAEHLIGLNKDQFLQILMLPQNEFSKLLLSDSESKEVLLRKIFNTKLYLDILDKLDKNRIQANSEFSLQKTRFTHLSGLVKDKHSDREGSALQDFYAQADTLNANQLLSGLNDECLFYQGEANQLVASVNLVQADFENVLQRLEGAKATNEQFAKLAAKRQELTLLELRQAKIEDLLDRLERFERVVTVLPLEARLFETMSHFNQKQVQLNEANQNYESSVAKLTEAENAYTQEKSSEPKRTEAERHLLELKQYMPVVREIDATEQKINTLKADLIRLEQSLQVATAKLSKLEQDKGLLSGDVVALERATANLPGMMEQESELRDQCKLQQEILTLHEQIAALRVQATEKGNILQQAEMDLQRTEQQWVAGQAATIAEHLHDGEQCPVCGSHEHPNKAKPADGAPTKEQVESLRRAKIAAESAYLRTEADLTSANRVVNEKEAEAQSRAWSQSFASQTIQARQERLANVSTAVQTLKGDLQRLSNLRAQVVSLDTVIAQLRSGKELQLAEQQTKLQEISVIEAVYQEKISAIPAALRNMVALEQALVDAQSVREQLFQAWQDAQERRQAASERVVATQTELNNRKENVVEAELASTKAREQFEAARINAGFATALQYEASKMEQSEAEQMKRETQQYQRDVDSVKAAIREYETNLQDKQPLDLTVLEQQQQTLRTQIAQYNERLAEAKQMLESAEQLQREIIKLQADLSAAENRYLLVQDLHNMLKGQNKDRISFERYVQIEFIEQIIAAANVRLRVMSKGQFYLELSDRVERNRGQSGLGFNVFDNYSGQTRDVKTMSGGEKFNASLSLALGMADVIQAYSGGVSLETMFIDEGFGTLDEESLGTAIDTLVELQKTGRMVGVISHMKDLKQVIPAKMEVVKNAAGYSSATITID